MKDENRVLEEILGHYVLPVRLQVFVHINPATYNIKLKS